MKKYKYNVICASLGRPSILRLIESLDGQLTRNDIFTIITEDNHDFVKSLLTTVDVSYNINHIIGGERPSGYYGHNLLNKYKNSVEGDFIMFADDDDFYTDDAFKHIREHVQEKKLYIFKHKWNGSVKWDREVFEIGNIGKCMGVIPNTKKLPDLKYNYDSDGEFYINLSKTMKYEFVNKLIYIVRDFS